MDLKNTLALSNWCRARVSLAEVERAAQVGLVDNQRFDHDQAVRAFRLLWTWAGTRYGGTAAEQQERFVAKCGQAALGRRIARAHAWIGRLAGNA